MHGHFSLTFGHQDHNNPRPYNRQFIFFQKYFVIITNFPEMATRILPISDHMLN